MVTSLAKTELLKYTENQLNVFFPDKTVSFSNDDIISALSLALDRTEFCLSKINVRGYSDEKGQTFFSHSHSDQYSQFLYFFANSLWTISENREICDKLILLNRMLHGCWYTYKVKLPDIFLLVHPLGSVIGHALYNDYLVVFQNVTIGEAKLANERDNKLSSLGQYLLLGAGSTIIGPSYIGNNVSIGINALVYAETIESNSIVIVDKDSSKRVIKKANGECRAKIYFRK